MKRFVLIGALMLGGCATTGGTVTTAQLISDAQQAATVACGFVPTAATVANIISVGNPLISTASAIAQAICSAVAAAPTTAAGKFRGALPTVNGVVIHGRFVTH
jgi:hypothetical protein